MGTRSSSRWLILADDVTGAADCAIAFARRGVESTVGWGERRRDCPVFSYNVNSRGCDADETARRHRAALARLANPGTPLFKKIDSTLRGQPAAEVAVIMDVLRQRHGSVFGILAPAFPANSRTTENGRILLCGKPLEDSEIWRRGHTYPSADLVEVLASAGVAGQHVALSTVRLGVEALRQTFAALRTRTAVAVCDAVTSEDLAHIAQASLPAPEGVFFIGSAGLAHALAMVSPPEGCAPGQNGGNGKGSLIVIGSPAEPSRTAARALARLPGVVHIRLLPGQLLDANANWDDLRTTLNGNLDAGDDVLVEICGEGPLDVSIGPRLAETLAEALQPAGSHIGGLAATGGETAAALFQRFGVDGIRLVDEIEPGVALGLTLGDICVPVATKAGAFGGEGSFIRIVERLRSIQRTGVLT